MIDILRTPLDAGELARAALNYDDAAAAIVARLAAPPEGRRWTALASRSQDGLDGVVFASVSDRRDSVGHLDLLAVDPAARRRGIGRALVGAAEEWLRAEGVTEVHFAGNPPCYAWPGIDVRYTPAICLAERLGYERYEAAWNMTADLTGNLSVDLSVGLSIDADLARLATEGITLHVAPEGERTEVVEFVRKQWQDSWAWEAEQATGLHYAQRDGEILGFAAWGARPLWFGPTGVAEEARGLGIGGVLLRRCLAEQAAAGLRSTQIGWVGPIHFYAKTVGARVERVFWLYRRHLGTPVGTLKEQP